MRVVVSYYNDRFRIKVVGECITPLTHTVILIPLTYLSQVLTLGKAQIYLVFNSLNRTSDLKVEGTPVREFQRKKCFSLEFHSLNRTSDLTVQGTHVRESKKKFGISFWILLT